MVFYNVILDKIASEFTSDSRGFYLSPLTSLCLPFFSPLTHLTFWITFRHTYLVICTVWIIYCWLYISTYHRLLVIYIPTYHILLVIYTYLSYTFGYILSFVLNEKGTGNVVVYGVSGHLLTSSSPPLPTLHHYRHRRRHPYYHHYYYHPHRCRRCCHHHYHKRYLRRHRLDRVTDSVTPTTSTPTPVP